MSLNDDGLWRIAVDCGAKLFVDLAHIPADEKRKPASPGFSCLSNNTENWRTEGSDAHKTVGTTPGPSTTTHIHTET